MVGLRRGVMAMREAHESALGGIGCLALFMLVVGSWLLFVWHFWTTEPPMPKFYWTM
jgi:hypothetical protein